MRDPHADTPVILALNAGSSSVKVALFRNPAAPARIVTASIDRIGKSPSEFRVRDFSISAARSAAPGSPRSSHTRRSSAAAAASPTRRVRAATHAQAAALIADWLERWLGERPLAGIGHRLVHGGGKVLEHRLITPAIRRSLQDAVKLDPTHLPRELAFVDVFRRRFPRVPQVACMDTAFHRDLPLTSTLLPVPRRFIRAGVRRYGFHGLSYEYLLAKLASDTGVSPRRTGRVIFAHLGSGASLAAVRDGKPVDTTMAFTPAAGLVMGTRPGDLDPGVVVHMLRAQRLSPDALNTLLNTECGLRGVSGTTSDVRDLLKRRAVDPHAREALDLFCWQGRKWLGAMAAALGGVDTIVFAGGVGEHAPFVRRQMCAGLAFLGLRLDERLNKTSAPGLLSTPGSRVAVRMIPTDEELVMARHVARIAHLARASRPARPSATRHDAQPRHRS